MEHDPHHTRIDLQSHLLNLPIELRLQIYEYTIPSGAFTITSAPISDCIPVSQPPSYFSNHACSFGSGTSTPYELAKPFNEDPQDKDSSSIPGLPPAHRIVVRRSYVPDILLPANASSQTPWQRYRDTGQRVSPSPEEMHMMMQIMHESHTEDDPDSRMGMLATYLWSHYMSSRPEGVSSSNTSSSCSPSSSRHDSEDNSCADAIAAYTEQALAEKEDEIQRATLSNNLRALYLTCRTIHAELSSLHHHNLARTLDLHVSYPTGVCILAHQLPHLLPFARTVRIAGICELSPIARSPEALSLARTHTAALEYVVTAILGKSASDSAADAAASAYAAQRHYQPTPPPTLHLRIFHPQLPAATRQVHGDVYPLVWQDPDGCSPVPRAMACVYGGIVENRVLRGRQGTGLELAATRRDFTGPKYDENGEKKGVGRVVTLRHPAVGRGWQPREWLLSEWEECEDAVSVKARSLQH